MKKFVHTPRRRYNQGKGRAKSRGISFNLTYKRYIAKLHMGCLYCGADTLNQPTGLALDRIDSRYGYTDKNTTACCVYCNRLKSDQLTAEETKMIVDFIRSIRYIKEGKPVWHTPRKRRRRNGFRKCR